MSPKPIPLDDADVSTQPALILASASPRRQDLLAELGVIFDVRPAAIDETLEEGESLADTVAALAERKARAVRREAIGEWILGADTIVVCDGRILGKPRDADDAHRMLRSLAGRWHDVITGIALVDNRSGKVARQAVTTRVRMRQVSDDEISAYIASGEPMDKAGSYAIQGQGGAFVKEIEGCYTNVVGLPLCATAELLRVTGISLLTPASPCLLPSGEPCPRLTPSRRARV